MPLKKIFFFFTILVPWTLASQEVRLLESGPKLSFRGMSVVNDEIVWVTGAKGTVGKSLDGGKTWEWMTVKGYEDRDFRDVEAFGKKLAVVMAVGEPAYILRTTDGGKSWKKVYENASSGMFLDAMDFYDEKNGIVVGDPIDGFFFLAHTSDGGRTWTKVENDYKAAEGEACFASSGSNIIYRADRSFEFVSGGTRSSRIQGTVAPPGWLLDSAPDSVHIHLSSLPLMEGKSSTGANSIAEKDFMNQMVVGGDFTAKDSAVDNCVFTYDGGRSWVSPADGSNPAGYRSCVEHVTGNTWICCGLNGVDISDDHGRHWKSISTASFHVCSKAKKGSAIYFAGNNGQIGKLVP